MPQIGWQRAVGRDLQTHLIDCGTFGDVDDKSTLLGKVGIELDVFSLSSIFKLFHAAVAEILYHLD
jgi:hypothetical protein